VRLPMAWRGSVQRVHSPALALTTDVRLSVFIPCSPVVSYSCLQLFRGDDFGVALTAAHVDAYSLVVTAERHIDRTAAQAEVAQR
jgi:hypothetical protein